ncbi:MAG: anthranilate phosphoribosyltransferase [Bacteroidales bacterium]|nr:anthranilate phosphoribosyltransferase [Bacteroidales bacterium]
MKDILNHLFQHKVLTREDSKEILIKLAKGKYNKSQMTAFLTVFQLRNITVDELQGFRDALLELSHKIELNGEFNCIDLCGTGGDGKNTFNISTLASFIVAGAGEKVAKHGNYGVSSTCGSSNILEYFGYNFSNDRDVIMRQLDKAGIAFLHAPLFHPAMKSIAPIRKELSIKTFFNMLGPMVNPLDPPNQLIGVFNLELARIYNYIYQQTAKNYAIVSGLDGYDEISLTGEFRLLARDIDTIEGPGYFGYRRIDRNAIAGGDTIKESAAIFGRIIRGEGEEEQNMVVLANAATALNVVYPGKSIGECLDIAHRSLSGGSAYKCFESLISESK